MISLPEMLFMQQCASDLAEIPEREYVFARPRRYRWDFAFVARKIAVEIDGAIWTQGRHTRGAGVESDMRKANLGVSLGWRIYRFSPAMVNNGEAINAIKEALR